MHKTYDVAAYVWPSYTGDCPQTRIFWEQGIGEWQTVQRARPKFEGHQWPRRPLWGYVNEADPAVMELQINAAVRHGVNVFIYDWYWYDNRPFLETCLHNGFLKAPNNEQMKFYIMWANHNVNYLWDRRNADGMPPSAVLYRGTHNAYEFECAADYVVEHYFPKPNYYKIDGKPVFCIYELANTIAGLGGLAQTKKALEAFERKTEAAGFPGLHLQVTLRGNAPINLSGIDTGASIDLLHAAEQLGFSSTTHYQYVHFADVNTTYDQIIPQVTAQWEEIRRSSRIPYYPHVSLGWDNNPRFQALQASILKNNTPRQIERILQKAKAFADQNAVPLITINSWNEWTEGSYLEPDDLYGYGYLEAVKRTFQ